jgi:hypothetical protein
MATATSSSKINCIHEVGEDYVQPTVVTKEERIRWRRIARKYISYYKNYLCFEDKEPIVVAWYDISMRYGGPEEGGYYYECGWPFKGICCFSKKQAIRAAIELHLEAYQDAGEEIDYLGWRTFSIDFKNEWPQPYPAVKPHYE